jgi:hypothetical protein
LLDLIQHPAFLGSTQPCSHSLSRAVQITSLVIKVYHFHTSLLILGVTCFVGSGLAVFADEQLQKTTSRKKSRVFISLSFKFYSVSRCCASLMAKLMSDRTVYPRSPTNFQDPNAAVVAARSLLPCSIFYLSLIELQKKDTRESDVFYNTMCSMKTQLHLCRNKRYRKKGGAETTTFLEPKPYRWVSRLTCPDRLKKNVTQK